MNLDVHTGVIYVHETDEHGEGEREREKEGEGERKERRRERERECIWKNKSVKERK